jgi:hypothetical protein
MKVNLNNKNTNIEITYDEYGCFDYVTNLDTNEKMMIEIYQTGKGYEIKKENRFITTKVCDVRYIRIMELNIFIPKFIFIENE